LGATYPLKGKRGDASCQSGRKKYSTLAEHRGKVSITNLLMINQPPGRRVNALFPPEGQVLWDTWRVGGAARALPKERHVVIKLTSKKKRMEPRVTFSQRVGTCGRRRNEGGGLPELAGFTDVGRRQIHRKASRRVPHEREGTPIAPWRRLIHT